MMLMKGGSGSSEQWSAYIETLVASGTFRGGSALGNGQCMSQRETTECTINGFMKFEAASMNEVLTLTQSNPTLLSGGSVEVLEIIET
ncbi:MAG: hypothetical protein AB8B79_22330 [Granulosicoccus sp.]